MAIPILSEIEKLINEHGSATIMKERLALAADQYSALEKKLSSANIRIEQLEFENESLKLNIQQAGEKIRNLEEKFIECQDLPLKEIEINILKYICEKPMTAKEISHQLGPQEEIIKFHLEELKNKNMVCSSYVPLGVGDIWSLEQLGRKYLVENNLIK